jgi:hypothetical protein
MKEHKIIITICTNDNSICNSNICDITSGYCEQRCKFLAKYKDHRGNLTLDPRIWAHRSLYCHLFEVLLPNGARCQECLDADINDK